MMEARESLTIITKTNIREIDVPPKPPLPPPPLPPPPLPLPQPILDHHDDDRPMAKEGVSNLKPSRATAYLFKSPYALLKLLSLLYAIVIIVCSVEVVGNWYSVFIAMFQLLTSLSMLVYNCFTSHMLLDVFLTAASTFNLLLGAIFLAIILPTVDFAWSILIALILADAVILGFVDIFLTCRRYFHHTDGALFYAPKLKNIRKGNGKEQRKAQNEPLLRNETSMERVEIEISQTNP